MDRKHARSRPKPSSVGGGGDARRNLVSSVEEAQFAGVPLTQLFCQLRTCSSSQFDPVVRRMNQILLGAQVPFSGLDRCVAQEKLDLLDSTSRGATHCGETAPQVVWCNSRYACGIRIRPKGLPHDFLRHALAVDLIAAVDRPHDMTVRDAGPHGPRVDSALHPIWYWNRAYTVMLASEAYNAPPSFSLLDVLQRDRSHLSPAKAT